MTFEEKYREDPKHYEKKVYKSQKVKLYKIKHWIFDFAGVLVGSPNILTTLIQVINSDLGTNIAKSDPFVYKNRRKMSSGRITSREFLQMIFEHYDVNSKKEGGALPPKKANVEYYLELWFELYSKATHLSPEMEEVIERFHEAGYIVSLLSNTYDIHAKSNELKGFFDLFDHVFLSNEMKGRKPEIEQYKYVLKKLDAKPKECIFIDDKLMNLVPARKLGITVIQFKSFSQFKEYLDELGIRHIEKDLKDKIEQKYQNYVSTKKDYKRIKKEYKKAKKMYKKFKKKRKKRKIGYFKYRKAKKKYKFLKEEVKNVKQNYKRFKKLKKKQLEPKLKLEIPNNK